MVFSQKELYTTQDLLSIMELLRSACPWDKQQTHKSIRKNLIEETYEVAAAIDSEDCAQLKEELGDLLLQVVFHAQMEKECGNFNFADVCDALCKKLIARHPHVFGGKEAKNAEQALQSWDEIKKNEKQDKTAKGAIESVPRCFPALMRSQKVQGRAAKSGFDYPEVGMAMSDLRSEIDELEQALCAGEAAGLEEELGDLIFSVVNVSRFVGVDCEEALTKSCDKFIARFEKVESLARERDIDMQKADIKTLNGLWTEAKEQSKKTEVVKHDKGRTY